MQIQIDTTTKLDRYPALFSSISKLFKYRRISRKDDSPLRILSFGCSSGEELLTIKTYLNNSIIFGCDVNKKMLELAKAKSPSATVFYSTPSNLAAHGPYDLILCLSVFCVHDVHERNVPTIFPFTQYEDIFTGSIRSNLSPNGVVAIVNSNYFFDELGVSSEFKAIKTPAIPENTFTKLYFSTGELAADRKQIDYYGIHEIKTDRRIHDNWLTDCLYTLGTDNYIPDETSKNYRILKSNILNFPPDINRNSKYLYRGRIESTIQTCNGDILKIGNNFRRSTSFLSEYFMGPYSM